MAEASRPSERMIRGTDEQVRHSAFVIGGGAEHHEVIKGAADDLNSGGNTLF